MGYAIVQTFYKMPELKQYTVKFISPSGICSSGLVCVGEAGGYNESLEGKPFVGRAGQLLNKMLNYIGLTRENTYVTNVVKIGLNRTPTDEELLSWKPLLIKEIKEVKPKVILALGRCAAQTILNTQESISKLRGKIFTLKNGMKVVPMFHPAFLLRSSGDKKIDAQVKSDLKLVQKLLNE